MTLEAGYSVIADAVFASRPERDRIEAVARDAGVPFIGLWIDGPPEMLARRLRERAVDASDATPDVLELQLRADPGWIGWHRLDGSLDAERVRRAAESVLIGRKPSHLRRPA
jgi:predicted kinase